MRDARTVYQSDFAELSVPTHPLAGAGTGDTHFGRDV